MKSRRNALCAFPYFFLAIGTFHHLNINQAAALKLPPPSSSEPVREIDDDEDDLKCKQLLAGFIGGLRSHCCLVDHTQ